MNEFLPRLLPNIRFKVARKPLFFLWVREFLDGPVERELGTNEGPADARDMLLSSPLLMLTLRGGRCISEGLTLRDDQVASWCRGMGASVDISSPTDEEGPFGPIS